MIMGPVERAQRDAQRAEERRKRREIMLAAQTGTPVTGYGLWKQRRDAGWTEYTDELGNRRWKPPAAEAQAKPEEKPATVQRSPEEKPAAVQQDGGDVNAFGSFKQNIASGLVRKMDINGNWRWVDPIRKVRADTGMPLNPGRTAGGTVSVQPDSAAKPPDTSAEGAQPTLSDDKAAQITDVNAPTVETETSMGTIGRQTTETQRAADRAEDPGISKAAHAVADANIKAWTTEMENHAADERDAAVANMIAGVGQDHDYTPLNTQMERQRTEEVSLASLDQFMPEQRPPERMQPDGNDDEEKDQAASKAGYAGRFDVSRNFLATDRVPDSIFGYPVVSREEDYTEEDIAFFKDHPEAGGYYDLGESQGDEKQGAVSAGVPMLFGVVPIGPAGTRAIDRAVPGGSRNAGELASGVMASKGLVVPDPPLRKDGLARLWGANMTRWFGGVDGDKVTLGDVLDFTDHGGGRVLAKAYPWLPSLPVGSEDFLRDSKGNPLRGVFHAYRNPQPIDRAHGAITISRESDWRQETNGKSDVWTTILHEMVHAIQQADPDMLPLRYVPETYAQSLDEWQSRVTERTADSRAKITAGSAESYGKQVMSSAFREGNPNVPEDPLPLVINVEKKGD